MAYKERRKEHDRKYYAEHREEILARNRKYHDEHKEEIRELNRKYRVEHKEELKEYYRKYYDEHKEDLKEYARKYGRKYGPELRLQALSIFGTRCNECGCTDIRVLQIDHVNGGGAKERNSIGTIGIYKKVIATDGEGYQCLCANCNWIKKHENNENANCVI